jgi:type II secretory pathway pseudopilin PulG
VKKKSDDYALVLTMVLLVVLSVLGTAILSIAFGETKMVANQVENKRAYYAARSGADAMASYIIDNSSNSNIATIVSNLITKTLSNPGTGTVGSNTFAVQVSNINSGPYNGDLLIESQGTADAGNLPVKISLVLTQGVRSAFETAIFSTSETFIPQIGNNTLLSGDIGTNAPSINFGSNPVDGSVILGPGASQANIDTANDNCSSGAGKLNSIIEFEKASESDFPVTVTGSKPVIDVTNNNEIIKVKAPDLTDLSKNANFQLNINATPGISGAQVHVLVDDPFKITNPLTVPEGVTLYVYYNGTERIIGSGLIGMSKIVIRAPFAIVDCTGGGSGSFSGKILAKEITLPNSGVTVTNDSTINLDEIPGIDKYQRDVWLKS